MTERESPSKALPPVECPYNCSLFHFYGKCEHKCVPVKPRRDTISKGNIGYMKQKRDYVIEETVSSEAEYLDRLNILWTCYALPLKEKNIVTAEDLNTLFHQWEAILSTHQAFYAELSTKLKDHTLNIGATFLKFSHYFTQYKAYLTNYSDSRDKISEMMTKNQQFREFCNITREDARCKGLKVMDLMIEPIARIPRYKLLLERLLKNTPEGDDSEYDVITSALNKVKEIAMENNESVSESEAIRKNQSDMIELTMSLSWGSHVDVSTLNLFDDPNRSLKMSGILLRQTRRAVREMMFWVLSDKLLYGEAVSGFENSFVLHRCIPFRNCRANIPPPRHDCHDYERAMFIESPQKSFIVWTKTEREKSEWLKCLQNAIFTERNNSMNNGKEIAPMWTPNQATSVCESCDKEFSVLFGVRRHHCRNCGDVICGACSTQTFWLPHVDSDKEVRVCDRCFDWLIRESKVFNTPEDYYNTKLKEEEQAGVFSYLTKSIVGKTAISRRKSYLVQSQRSNSILSATTKTSPQSHHKSDTRHVIDPFTGVEKEFDTPWELIAQRRKASHKQQMERQAKLHLIYYSSDAYDPSDILLADNSDIEEENKINDERDEARSGSVSDVGESVVTDSESVTGQNKEENEETQDSDLSISEDGSRSGSTSRATSQRKSRAVLLEEAVSVIEAELLRESMSTESGGGVNNVEN